MPTLSTNRFIQNYYSPHAIRVSFGILLDVVAILLWNYCLLIAIPC